MKTKILIVDDSEIQREVVRFVLEHRGFEVVVADSPFELPALLREHDPALLLLDVSMPALRGDAIVDILRRNQLELCPFVLYSGLPESELAQLASSSGAAGFIRKTDDFDALGREVERYLAAAGGQR